MEIFNTHLTLPGHIIGYTSKGKPIRLVAGGSEGFPEGGSGDGNNPAWDDLLGAIPEEHHQAVLPHLQKFDQGVQTRLSSTQQQYAPWKEFIDGRIDPEDARYALGLVNALNDRPEEVYKAIGDFYKFGGSDSGDIQQPSGDEDKQTQLPPEYQQLQNLVLTMADSLVQSREEKIAQQEDDALNEEIDQVLADKGLELDDRLNKYIVGHIVTNDSTVEEAVNDYLEFIQHVRGGAVKMPAPPRLIPGGGPIPTSRTVDPRKLSAPDRRQLIVDMLNAANREG